MENKTTIVIKHKIEFEDEQIVSNELQIYLNRNSLRASEIFYLNISEAGELVEKITQKLNEIKKRDE